MKKLDDYLTVENLKKTGFEAKEIYQTLRSNTSPDWDTTFIIGAVTGGITACVGIFGGLFAGALSGAFLLPALGVVAGSELADTLITNPSLVSKDILGIEANRFIGGASGFAVGLLINNIPLGKTKTTKIEYKVKGEDLDDDVETVKIADLDFLQKDVTESEGNATLQKKLLVTGAALGLCVGGLVGVFSGAVVGGASVGGAYIVNRAINGTKNLKLRLDIKRAKPPAPKVGD